jgi:hypothetical protein
MADSHKPVPTVFPPAVWRRLAEESKSDGEFLADLMEHAKLDNAADAAIRAELVQLAEQLYDQLIDRAERLIALGRLLPKARDEREAIALAGLVWEDSGLPQPLPLTVHGFRRTSARRENCSRGWKHIRRGCRSHSDSLGVFVRCPPLKTLLGVIASGRSPTVE